MRNEDLKGGSRPRVQAPVTYRASVHGNPNVHMRNVSAADLRGGSDDSHRGPDASLGVLVSLALALVIVLGFGAWWFLLRSVTVTVNGEPVETSINTKLDSFIEANSNFGAKPGRLLSVSGNVLSEDGGNKYSVTFNNKELVYDKVSSKRLEGGEKIDVSDGADTTEPYTETTEEVQPGIQMETGGAIQYVRQWGKVGKRKLRTGETSGEVAEGEWEQEVQDMIVASVNPNPQGDKKYMALTFDDGPSEYTQKILDILKEKGAKATFFNLGGNANANPALTKQVVDNGNQLASHTMQHQNLPTLDRDGLRNEITTAFDALNTASGSTTQMIRAPYGAFTATEWARSGDLISCNVLWNIDTLDWKRPGAEAIKNEILSKARNGRIALMHDGGGDRNQDIEALPGIIDGLRAQGYELVTVSELMQLDGNFPQEVIDGTVSLPEGCTMPQA